MQLSDTMSQSQDCWIASAEPPTCLSRWAMVSKKRLASDDQFALSTTGTTPMSLFTSENLLHRQSVLRGFSRRSSFDVMPWYSAIGVNNSWTPP